MIANVIKTRIGWVHGTRESARQIIEVFDVPDKLKPTAFHEFKGSDLFFVPKKPLTKLITDADNVLPEGSWIPKGDVHIQTQEPTSVMINGIERSREAVYNGRTLWIYDVSNHDDSVQRITAFESFTRTIQIRADDPQLLLKDFLPSRFMYIDPIVVSVDTGGMPATEDLSKDDQMLVKNIVELYQADLIVARDKMMSEPMRDAYQTQIDRIQNIIKQLRRRAGDE